MVEVSAYVWGSSLGVSKRVDCWGRACIIAGLAVVRNKCGISGVMDMVCEEACF